MRTIEEIKSNIASIEKTMSGIRQQIEILDKEYQQNAIENIGERDPDIDKMINNLRQSLESLNTHLHMERDFQFDLESDDSED